MADLELEYFGVEQQIQKGHRFRRESWGGTGVTNSGMLWVLRKMRDRSRRSVIAELEAFTWSLLFQECTVCGWLAEKRWVWLRRGGSAVGAAGG